MNFQYNKKYIDNLFNIKIIVFIFISKYYITYIDEASVTKK